MAMTLYNLLMVVTLSIVGLVCMAQFIDNYSHNHLALATVDIGLVFVILSIIGHITSRLSDEMGGRLALVGLLIILTGMLLKHFEDVRFKKSKYISKK